MSHDEYGDNNINNERQLVVYQAPPPTRPRIETYEPPPWFALEHYELFANWDSYEAGKSWAYGGWHQWFRQIMHVSRQLTHGFEVARQCENGVLVTKAAQRNLKEVRRQWTKYWIEFSHPDEGILFHWMQKPGHDGVMDRVCAAIHLYVEWARLTVLCLLEQCYDRAASPDWSLCRLTTLTHDQTLAEWGALRRCNAMADFPLLCQRRWTMYPHPIVCYSQRELIQALDQLKLHWKHLMIHVRDSGAILPLVRELKRYVDTLELRAAMFLCEPFPGRVLDEPTMSACLDDDMDVWQPTRRFCFRMANDFFWFKRSLFYYHHAIIRQHEESHCAWPFDKHAKWAWSDARFQQALEQWYRFQEHCFSEEQQQLESTDNPFLPAEQLVYDAFGLCYGDEQWFEFDHPHESNNIQNMVEKIYSKKKWRWIRTIFDMDVQPLVRLDERQCDTDDVDGWQQSVLKVFLVFSSVYEELRIISGNQLDWLRRYVVLHSQFEQKRFMLERCKEPLIVECIPGYFTVLHNDAYYEAPNIDQLMVVYCYLVHTCHHGRLLDGETDISKFLAKIVSTVDATPAGLDDDNDILMTSSAPTPQRLAAIKF